MTTKKGKSKTPTTITHITGAVPNRIPVANVVPGTWFIWDHCLYLMAEDMQVISITGDIDIDWDRDTLVTPVKDLTFSYFV